MKGQQLRADLSNLLFSAFSIISVFTLIDPFISGTTETIMINSQKLYVNLGWMGAYFLTLAITFFLILIFMDKKQVLLTCLGIVLGSLPIIERYQVPGVVKVMNLFEKQGGINLQVYIPYVAVLIGTLLVLGLLKGANKIFK